MLAAVNAGFMFAHIEREKLTYISYIAYRMHARRSKGSRWRVTGTHEQQPEGTSDHISDAERLIGGCMHTHGPITDFDSELSSYIGASPPTFRLSPDRGLSPMHTRPHMETSQALIEQDSCPHSQSPLGIESTQTYHKRPKHHPLTIPSQSARKSCPRDPRYHTLPYTFPFPFPPERQALKQRLDDRKPRKKKQGQPPIARRPPRRRRRRGIAQGQAQTAIPRGLFGSRAALGRSGITSR
jgi:hypothetical protein